jgi:hypothetical protein
VSDSQFEKQQFPILRTDAGIVTVLNDSQPENAKSSITASFEPLSNPTHWRKAHWVKHLARMISTDAGMHLNSWQTHD